MRNVNSNPRAFKHAVAIYRRDATLIALPSLYGPLLWKTVSFTNGQGYAVLSRRCGSSYGLPATVAVVGVFSFFSASPMFLRGTPHRTGAGAGTPPEQRGTKRKNTACPAGKRSNVMRKRLRVYTSLSHIVEHRSLEPSCPGLIEAGRLRANIEGVSYPYEGYTPLVRKARITRLTLMPICCRCTAGLPNPRVQRQQIGTETTPVWH